MERLTAEPLRDAIAELREENQRLRRVNASLRKQAQRQNERAAAELASWHRVHDAMNLLREDAMRVLRENGVEWLHAQLEKERTETLRLHRVLSRRRGISRRAVEKMAEAQQQVRDLEAALDEMRQQVALVEQQRDDVDKTAQKTVGELQAKLDRIGDQCRLWNRGELDTMTTIAGIAAEMNGHPLPEPGAWERAKAVRAAEILSQHREMSLQLGEIEDVLREEGFSLRGTHADLVRRYIDCMRPEEEK